jgi:hypothetical protein
MNKSNNNLADNTHERSTSNHSFLTKEKADLTNESKSQRKSDTLLKNLENATKKIMSKENNKHYRHSSMEVKYSTEKVPTKSPTDFKKNIHAMKDLINPSTNLNKTNALLKNTQSIMSSSNTSTNTHTNTNTSLLKPNTKSSFKHGTSSSGNNKLLNDNSSSFILNQGIPCFNNINIYTTNNSNNIKANEINLRYILNKVNTGSKTSNKPITKPTHLRTGSNNGL